MKTLINPAKRRLSEGRAICGFGVTIASAGVAQVLSRTDADFLTIDLEHGALDASSAHALIAATAGSNCVPVVRVPTTKSWAVKPVLDAGALGIVFPMIRGAGELEEGIASVLYPPSGKRGIGHHFAPARWSLTASDYLRSANDALLKIALIETSEAVESIQDILAVPGLDVATIAPGDLAASLGHPGDLRHDDVVQAIRRVERAVLGTGVALGGVAFSATEAKRKIEAGYKLLVLGFDVGLLEGAAIEMVNAVQA